MLGWIHRTHYFHILTRGMVISPIMGVICPLFIRIPYWRWWFHIFFMFTPFKWRNDPIWRACFSIGLKPHPGYRIPQVFTQVQKSVQLKTSKICRILMIPNHCNFSIYSCQPGAVDNTSKSGFGPPGVFFPTAWVAFKSDVIVKTPPRCSSPRVPWKNWENRRKRMGL